VASGPSVSAAIDYLNMELGSDRDIRFWTVPPNRDGTGGVEVSGGGYAPAVLSSNPATPGAGAQIAKATNAVGFYFTDMPAASDDVVAVSVHVHSTGEMRWLNDSWVAPMTWDVGQSPLFPPDTFALAFVPVS